MSPDGDETAGAGGRHHEFMCEDCQSNSCYHLLIAGRVTSIHMTETAARPSQLENDDLIREILLRLPPHPSSLPRASLVRKRWRRIISEPHFLRLFRAHHRKAPLLGFFSSNGKSFIPVLDPPDRVDPERFSLGDLPAGLLLGCRHGRVLLMNRSLDEVSVCDPITGEHLRLAVSSEFTSQRTQLNDVKGTVLCADGEQGHVHGSCHSSPFKVILVSMHKEDRQPIACVYSSETSMWGNIISSAVPQTICGIGDFSILLGNSVYWPIRLKNGHAGILELSLDSLSLTVTKVPPIEYSQHMPMLIQANKDGGIGLATVAYPNLHIWRRKVDCHGAATWVLWKTVDLQTFDELPKSESLSPSQISMARPLGYVEDADSYTCGLLSLHDST